MGHIHLKTLTPGYSLYTGDAFEYMYIKGPGGLEMSLPATELYKMLEDQLRSQLIREVEQGEHDHLTLAAALKILRDSAA